MQIYCTHIENRITVRAQITPNNKEQLRYSYCPELDLLPNCIEAFQTFCSVHTIQKGKFLIIKENKRMYSFTLITNDNTVEINGTPAKLMQPVAFTPSVGFGRTPTKTKGNTKLVPQIGPLLPRVDTVTGKPYVLFTSAEQEAHHAAGMRFDPDDTICSVVIKKPYNSYNPYW